MLGGRRCVESTSVADDHVSEVTEVRTHATSWQSSRTVVTYTMTFIHARRRRRRRCRRRHHHHCPARSKNMRSFAFARCPFTPSPSFASFHKHQPRLPSIVCSSSSFPVIRTHVVHNTTHTHTAPRKSNVDSLRSVVQPAAHSFNHSFIRLHCFVRFNLQIPFVRFVGARSFNRFFRRRRRRSSFIVRSSLASFVVGFVRRSSFVVRCSSFVCRRSSFVVRRSSSSSSFAFVRFRSHIYLLFSAYCTLTLRNSTKSQPSLNSAQKQF